MSIKAIALDDESTQHLIIGLNRSDVESILRGEVVVLPRGIVPALAEDSDIVVPLRRRMKSWRSGFLPRFDLFEF